MEGMERVHSYAQVHALSMEMSTLDLPLFPSHATYSIIAPHLQK